MGTGRGTKAGPGWWHDGRRVAVLIVATTWLTHGAYNKLAGGSPRHLGIVQSMPGLDGAAGGLALAVIGAGEVALALWVLAGRAPRLCAATQTAVLLSMNVAELAFARHLLLWPAALIPVNLAFLGFAWRAALPGGGARAWLRRHPLPITAHFTECLTITFALPAHVLRPFVPPGLELETVNGHGFVAVALVQTSSLRPSPLPAALGRDFFLAGYRVFTTFRRPDGRRLRGLRILRSDANRTAMVLGGNLLTHYNYHQCDAAIDASGDRCRVRVDTRDGAGDLDLSTRPANGALPAGSPFSSLKEARRFAGPLPFTFDYEKDTHAIVAIEAVRGRWRPEPIHVDVRRIAFFDQPAFRGVTPVLAGAFRVADVDYAWKRGRWYPLANRERAA
jgi:uncharacterized protein YqjF (DUF2071 family)